MNLFSILKGGEGHGKSLLKNTSWLFIGEIVGRLIRFWIVVYAARVLGASEYGLFSYALTVAAFATILSDIGISALLTRETSCQPELRQKYFNALLLVKSALILVVGAAIYALLPIFAGVEGINPMVPLIIAMFAFDSVREFGFGVHIMFA
jgi:O-antigen/teichoic acid export membrane protein